MEDADWSVLSQQEASPEEVARAVVSIMMSLKKALSSPTPTLQKPHPMLKRKSRRKLLSLRKGKNADTDATSGLDSGIGLVSPYDMRGASEVSVSSSELEGRRKWWKRFVRFFKRRS